MNRTMSRGADTYGTGAHGRQRAAEVRAHGDERSW
jgi:hypothetical protein